MSNEIEKKQEEVKVEDLKPEELQDKDLEKVAGGCDGMKQDPTAVRRVK